MRKLRIFQSSMTKSPYSLRSANQRDFHSVVTPEPEPVGVDLLTHQLASPRSSSPRRLVVFGVVFVGALGCVPRPCSSSSTDSASSASSSPPRRRRPRRRPRRPRSSRRWPRRSVLDRDGVAVLVVGRGPSWSWSWSCSRSARAAWLLATRARRASAASRRTPPRPTAASVRARRCSSSSGVHAAHDDRDVAGALADAGGAAAGTGAPALERGALVGVAGRHVELVGVDLVVLLGVGDGRGEHLADVGGDGALGELEDLVGVVDVQAADEVEDLAGLVGRHAEVARPRRGCRAARWSWCRRPSATTLALASPCRRGTGRCGWGRTRRACGRPSPR